MSETKWTKKICEELEDVNTVVLVIAGGNMFQQSGLPDRYICHTLWKGWLEFKGPNTKIDKKQAYYIREMNSRHPGTAFIVREPDSIEDHRGQLVRRFDGTGHGLIRELDWIAHHVDLTGALP